MIFNIYYSDIRTLFYLSKQHLSRMGLQHLDVGLMDYTGDLSLGGGGGESLLPRLQVTGKS